MLSNRFGYLKLVFFLIFTCFQYQVCANNNDENSIIDRIEPPFWWVGMQNSKLQLMLYGDNIAQFKVSSKSADFVIESVEKTDNPNYLFLNLKVSVIAKAGAFELQISKDKKIVHTVNYELKERKQGSHLRQGFNASDVIYLITPDRFANGDIDNDKVDSLKEGLDRSHDYGRHGGDIQGIIDHLDYIENMGFTQIWLNPVLENDMKRSSYHGYSTTDYYKIDPRFGSNDLYKQLSEKAQQKGIGIIKDVILNHIGSEHWWMNDLPSNDWINNLNSYVETTHRRESLHDPHATDEDIEAFASGWFVRSMPDLNQRNSLLANYLIQNNIWWIEYADLSGLRVDTYSYSDKNFLADYSKRLMDEYPNINIVGEEWSLSPIVVSYWQKGNDTHDNYHSELTSLMDFPLQDTLVKGLKEQETWSDGLRKLYETLANDFIYPNANNLVIFPDNHDMSRIYTQLGHDLELTELAITFFATTRGIPQYFYGTEIHMDNRASGSHGLIRSDFPGGWQGDKVNAFTGEGLSATQKSIQEYMRNLLNWRKKSEAIHKGKLTHYSPTNGAYVYFRHNENDKVMIVLNKSDKTVEIEPDDYSTMLSTEDKSRPVFDVISNKKLILNETINIPSKSALVIQF